MCEKAVGAERSCDFRSGKMILQQPIERAQMQKLLATGRTDLLTRFISKKGRPFKAYLVKTAEGKVGFEFEPRSRTPARPRAPRRRGTASAPSARAKRSRSRQPPRARGPARESAAKPPPKPRARPHPSAAKPKRKAAGRNRRDCDAA